MIEVQVRYVLILRKHTEKQKDIVHLESDIDYKLYIEKIVNKESSMISKNKRPVDYMFGMIVLRVIHTKVNMES